MDLRCASKKHAVVIDDHTLEIKCNSRFCGAGEGTVVLHIFDIPSGELMHTRRFKDPKGKVNSLD